MDTDVLVAIVASSLPHLHLTDSAILSALADSDGNVETAVSSLRRRQSGSPPAVPPSPARKRKRENPLTAWLYPQTVEPCVDRVPAAESQSAGGDGRAPKSVTAQPLSSVLKQPTPPPATLPRLPPLTLATSELITMHTPTTMHTRILPPKLACDLFYTLLGEAETWPRNSWYLFDRMVTSPHRTTFYVRSSFGSDKLRADVASFWYNGRHVKAPDAFPPVLEEACRYVEDTVNNEMRARRRYPLEWAGDGATSWCANVAAANCYEGMKEGVGYHADALTYLGPQCTIASLSLGCVRQFRLRETISPDPQREPRTYNIPLPHNSLLIMHPPTQERFKHTIPSQTKLDIFRPPFPQRPGEEIQSYNQRLNITFRFYRPDFYATVPLCKCGIPAILRSDLKGRATNVSGADSEGLSYFWQCDAGKVNGKGCGLWRQMDWRGEGRGPMMCER